jgi:hypothetical protein
MTQISPKDDPGYLHLSVPWSPPQALKTSVSIYTPAGNSPSAPGEEKIYPPGPGDLKGSLPIMQSDGPCRCPDWGKWVSGPGTGPPDVIDGAAPSLGRVLGGPGFWNSVKLNEDIEGVDDGKWEDVVVC